MNLLELQPIFSTMWVVWFFVLFIGILVYVLAPRRRQSYQKAGDIPLRDDMPRLRAPVVLPARVPRELPARVPRDPS